MKKATPICVFSAGVLWGTMGVFVRQYNARGLASMDIVAIRAAVTAGIMFFFLLAYDRKLLRIRIRDIWCFLGTGLLSILFFNYCYFRAITMTSLSAAAVLLYTAPAIVIALSRFLFREKITGIKIVALLSTFAGCVFVTGILGSQEPLSAGGILTGLGAGLGYALYSIFSRYALEKGYSSLTITFYTFLITSIGVLPFVKPLALCQICTGSGFMIVFSLVFGLVSTVLPYILYTIGLTGVENGKASIIASVEPVVATLLGVLLFQEKLTVNGITGMALVLGGIVLCNINFHKETRQIKEG